MMQELFRIPFVNLPIYGYGLMLVIGLLVAMQVGSMLARRFGLDPEVFKTAAILALVMGIIGARASHVIESLVFDSESPYFSSRRTLAENLWAIVNIRSGGLTYYGGFLLAFPSLVLYARWKKIPIRLGMDIVAPCLMIGLAFGRIGCFLNGCCYGAVCDLPWAVTFPYGSYAYVEEVELRQLVPPDGLTILDRDGKRRLYTADEVRANPSLRTLAASVRSKPLHPAQIYSAITAFLIAGWCIAFLTMRPAHGRVFAGMLMVEGTTRFLLEMLRVEPSVAGSFSFSMVIGVCLVVVGFVMFVLFRDKTVAPAAPVVA